MHGRNFVRTMWELEAARIAALGATDGHGVFHATSSGEAGWYELAREAFRLAGADPDQVRRTGSRAFVRSGTAQPLISPPHRQPLNSPERSRR
ncbi:hypothetical protein [Streptomyces sp. NPDC007856]|uniref:hypothetical protein n=1 Tax=Streptomyces sp. NPDC007856 TaxID=3364781 RepID=UPI0036960A58